MLTQDEEMLYKVVGFLKSQNYQHSVLDLGKSTSVMGKSATQHGQSAIYSNNIDELKKKV
jgi:hypothetical protein